VQTAGHLPTGDNIVGAELVVDGWGATLGDPGGGDGLDIVREVAVADVGESAAIGW
jgi:hypothetical protein